MHGLLGAAFKTWRQKDLDVTEDDKVEGVREDYTECWPKVFFLKKKLMSTQILLAVYLHYRASEVF